MRFFTDLDEAERYARSRPYFHPMAMARAREAKGMEAKVPLALDVACGTGLSAVALASLAERVVGFDVSANMLAHAEGHERVRYVRARAEAMPFRSECAPVVACALAFHWLEREPFLRAARRVLQEEGLLFIYNNGFTGLMRENPEFQAWAQNDYQARFPTPPRDSTPFTAEEVAAAGFTFIQEERYENDVRFTPEQLVAYLTTQTNVAAAVDRGRETIASASAWLLAQVRPFFAAAGASFVFATRAWYLQKAAAR
jgi:SAM-dependent methyltransferase